MFRCAVCPVLQYFIVPTYLEIFLNLARTRLKEHKRIIVIIAKLITYLYKYKNIYKYLIQFDIFGMIHTESQYSYK